MTTLGVALAWGSDPSAGDRAAPRGRAGGPRARRPGRALPGPRQPDDRPRPGRPPDGGGRGRLRGDRGRPASRPRGGLRQLPGGQRRRVAVPARALAGGARAEHARPRLAPGRRHLPRTTSAAGDRRDRDGRPGRRRPGCSARPCSSSTPLREPQLAGPYYLAAASFALWRGDIADASRSVDRGWAVVRVDRGVGPRRPDGGDGRPGRCGGRRWRRASTASSPRSPAARQRTAEVDPDGRRASSGPAAPRRRPGRARSPRRSWRRPAAYQRRLEGDDDPAVWGRVADGVGRARRRRTSVALARWRQAEATLGSGAGRSGRADARTPAAGRGRDRAAGSRRDRCCASCGSWPDAPGSRCPTEVEAFLAEPVRPPWGWPSARSPRTPRPARRHRWRRWPVGPRPGRRRRSARGDRAARGHVRAERARARGAAAGRPGPDEPRDRGAAVHQPEDRRRPRREHPVQARRCRAGSRPRPSRSASGSPSRPLDSRRQTPRDPEGGLRVSIGFGFASSGWAPDEASMWCGLAPLGSGCEGQRDRDERADSDGEAPGSSDEVFGHLGLRSDDCRQGHHS